VFFSTFGAIFLAELGDKTQFAAIAVSAQSKSTLEILLGVVFALALAGALGVVAGRVLAQIINPAVMRWVSGSSFLVMGVWILLSKGGS